MNECKIVEDLLPLYAEDLISLETRKFVDTHCAGCESCEKFRARTQVNLDTAQTPVDYKKDLHRSVWRIIGRTILTAAAVIGLYIYVLWEWGFLDRQVYVSPDGTMRFEVVDTDSGLFEGGACIVTPEGQDRNLYGNKSYQDFHVWFSPDSKSYFAWIEFDDHDETYLMTSEYLEEGGYFTSRYFPSYEIEERDFLGVIKESELGQQYLNGDITITFDRWSQDSRYVYFNYEVHGGGFGEICFDCVNKEVVDITWKILRPVSLPIG